VTISLNTSAKKQDLDTERSLPDQDILDFFQNVSLWLFQCELLFQPSQSGFGWGVFEIQLVAPGDPLLFSNVQFILKAP
jgi:hypothetical protein